MRGDYSEVAIKRGEPPANPKKFAPYAAAINLIAGGIAVWVIFNVVTGGMEYDDLVSDRWGYDLAQVHR